MTNAEVPEAPIPDTHVGILETALREPQAGGGDRAPLVPDERKPEPAADNGC
jgi:hypothetical protein